MCLWLCAVCILTWTVVYFCIYFIKLECIFYHYYCVLLANHLLNLPLVTGYLYKKGKPGKMGM